jgi:CrcB protein
MKNVLLVGIGGFLGSIARFRLGIMLHAAAAARDGFPYATVAVNVVGCFVAGLLAGLAERHELFGPGTRLFLFSGLLGGFTTFSAFGLEAIAIVRRGEPWLATVYAGSSVCGGLVAVWLGMWLVTAVGGRA